MHDIGATIDIPARQLPRTLLVLRSFLAKGNIEVTAVRRGLKSRVPDVRAAGPAVARAAGYCREPLSASTRAHRVADFLLMAGEKVQVSICFSPCWMRRASARRW